MEEVDQKPNTNIETYLPKASSPPAQGPPSDIVSSSDAPLNMGDPNRNGGGGGSKKSSARRNAWGNLSYADLITQAIQSAPDKRLTLSQVYEWMVQNIPYFKDKGDSNSSAGWKVRNQEKYRNFDTICINQSHKNVIHLK